MANAESSGVESVPLSSLVHHRGVAEASLALEHLDKYLRTEGIAYAALTDEERVIGIASRERLGSILGSRYGFSLFSRCPATDAAVGQPLIFAESTPIRQVLDASLGRDSEAFHEDVALVDAAGRLIGLIPIERLAQLQSRLVREQLVQLEQSREELRLQNLDLFQANNALRQAQGLYVGLFHSNTLGVALLDPRGGVQAHNARFARLLNLGDGPLASVPLSAWMPEPDRGTFTGLIEAERRAVDDAEPTAREFTLNIPGKGARLFRFTVGWIRETGQLCACIDDITGQRALERGILRQEKQRLLDTLVGGIAHELNNKLTPIQGFAELLGSQASPEVREFTHLITASVQEAAKIVRQLLQLAKPEATAHRCLDLREVVSESLAILRFKLREGRCTLAYEPPAEPHLVEADPGQLKQVVMNLVINAVQAMERTREPRLTVALEHGPQGVLLSVEDNGSGIPPDIMGRIFDPFFTTKGPDRGTGLGLSVCESIVTQCGGTLGAESTVGVGTRFLMTLPRRSGLDLPEPAAQAAVVGTRRMGRRRARILVVDDDPVIRMLLQEMLRAVVVCEVEMAADGLEGLQRAGSEEFDLILSDMRMPGISGAELFLRLRERQPGVARRFAFITGYPGDEDLNAEVRSWQVALLPKPFTMDGLMRLCQPLLSALDQAAV